MNTLHVIIPPTIPEGVLKVHIEDFITKNVEFELHQDIFRSENWANVQSLELTNVKETNPSIKILNAAFKRLENLKVLKIRIENLIELDPDSLLGLDTLQSLDFSKCFRLSFEEVTTALKGPEKVPNLEYLNLSELQLYRDGFKIEEDFYRCLQDKQVRILDMSGTHITHLNVTIFSYLNSLEVLNLSLATVDHMLVDCLNKTTEDVTRLQLFDRVLYLIEQNPPVLKGLTFANLYLPFYFNKLFKNIYVYNIAGIIENLTLSFYNTNVWCPSEQKIWSKIIIARENGVHNFDVNIDCSNCDFTSLQQLDVAYNNLEYIHPSVHSCFPSLEQLDLSRNRLYIMYEEHFELFRRLLNSYENLRSINLASNNLTDLPEDFFGNNLHLTSINLKGNKLTQIHFKLVHLKELGFVDISNNNIKSLDSLSISRLDALDTHVHPETVSISKDVSTIKPDDKNPRKNILVHVVISGNPCTCIRDCCKTIASIKWLTKTNIIFSDEPACHGKNDKPLKMNTAENEVQEISYRVTKIVAMIVTSVVIGFIVLTVIYFLHS
ncbi:hypothetical protein ACF0H5_012939 [Mactra antiquata]